MTQDDDQAPGVAPSRDSAAETAALVQRCKSSPRRKSKPKEKAAAVVAMLGAGLQPRRVGRELGIPSRTVRDIALRAEKDPELAMIRHAAKEKLQDKALEMMDRWMVSMEGDFEGASLKEKATAFREIREVGMPRTWNEHTPPGSGPTVQIQTQDPAVMAAMVEALRGLNEPSCKTIEAKVIKEE